MGARWGPDEQTASCLSGSTVCYLLTYYVRCHRCSQQAGLRHAVGNRSVWYSTTVWFWQVHSLRQVCITRQQSVELLLCLYFHWGLLDWPPAIQVVPNRSLWAWGCWSVLCCWRCSCGDLFFLGNDVGEMMAAVDGRLLHEMLGAH